jgi:diguanylate cyclase (GGDEF)-like protein
MYVAVRRHPRSRYPERVGAAGFAALQVNLAVSVALTGGADSVLLPLMCVPVFSQAVCFRPPVFRTGMLASALLASGAVLVGALLPPVDRPPAVVGLVAVLALLCCLGLAAHSLAAADLHSRDEAVADPMTGLYNRLTLASRFAEATREAAREGGAIAVVMCDVDHFEQVNDTHGHDRGDEVLVELATRLRAALRASDVAYRVGGEEFVLLLPGRDIDDAVLVAERVRRAVEASPVAGLAITVSAGVACTRGAGATLSELLREADRALYAAKAAGRNQVLAPDAALVRPAAPPRHTDGAAGPPPRLAW